MSGRCLKDSIPCRPDWGRSVQPSSRPFLRSCARVACYLRFAGPPVHGDIQIATGEMGVPGRNATGRFRRPEGRLLPTATALPIVSIARSIPLLRLAHWRLCVGGVSREHNAVHYWHLLRVMSPTRRASVVSSDPVG